jgi:hypothetical protein
LVSVTERVALDRVQRPHGGLDRRGLGGDRVERQGNYHLDQQLMTWYAVSLREKRAIGHAEPGFEVTARLRMAMQPGTAPPELADSQLATLPPTTGRSADLLSFQSDHADFRLLHDRRWRSMIDRHDLSVFRLVDRGDLIAQCNISELPDFEPGRHLSLDEFRADVQEKLGEHFGQIVEASQTESEPREPHPPHQSFPEWRRRSRSSGSTTTFPTTRGGGRRWHSRSNPNWSNGSPKRIGRWWNRSSS